MKFRTIFSFKISNNFASFIWNLAEQQQSIERGERERERGERRKGERYRVKIRAYGMNSVIPPR
jgi:hypothetical protein